MADTKKSAQQDAATFKKADILKAEKYKAYEDVLETELDADKDYTAEEIDAVIKGALSRKVVEKVNP